MTDEQKITLLEERLAHTIKAADDLSDVVADQAKRITLLEKQMAALLELARDQSQGEGSVTFSD
ncbi:SlyX family protein [Neptunicoccus cionae]|uniref:SlyX family protein n=1 Tax=Neptunicoccus cionae TaxID=2035344 RepID=UPI000C78D746|nr:SlyX family protein [Amylibacter cionae]PLS21726.1 SlyX protein [Amylibacter cionae]